MVVGAGAAFSDQSKIKNTEAVDACTALNIIGGYPDGSFKPEGNITRAEVTKMICVALNGGKEPNLATNATPTFSDVRTNANSAWAEKYIESCYAQGIVSGVGAGKFAPAGNVTGTQLAKMLLVSLGYNPDIEKFTGNAWATNVNIIATQKGLYEGLESIDVSAALTRDNAAQMIWNALKAGEVKYEYTLVSENGTLVSKTTLENKKGTDGKDLTMLKDKYSVTTREDVTLETISKDDKGTYNVTAGGSYTKVEKDYSDLMGQKVDVLVKDNDNSKVFGIYANEDSTVVATGVIGDLDTVSGTTTKVKFNDKEYKLDDNNKVIIFNKTASYSKSDLYSLANTATGVEKAYAIKLIDNDGNGKVDTAVVTSFVVGKVSYVGSNSYTFAKVGSFEAIGNQDKDDVVAYDGIAKDDYVVIYKDTDTVSGDYVVNKLNKVTGKVTATKSSETKGQIDGTWYESLTSDTFSRNDTVDVYEIAGYAFHIEVSESGATSADALFVDDAEVKTSGLDTGLKAKMYLTDGTSVEAKISKISFWDSATKKFVKYDVVTGTPAAADELKVADGNDTLTTDGLGKKIGINQIIGGLYTYSKDGSKYEIKVLSDTNKCGYKGYATLATTDGYKNKLLNYTYLNGSAATGTLKIADDAVLFVQGKDDTKVMTGKQVNAWGDVDYDLVSGQAMYSESNGFKYAKVGALVLTSSQDIPDASDDTAYGYVISDIETITENNTDYCSFSIWTEKGEKTVRSKTTEFGTGIEKGDFITYNIGDGTIVKDVEKYDIHSAVTGYASGSTDINLNGTVKYADGTNASAFKNKLADNAKIIYVNTKDKKGVEGGSITVADKDSDVGESYIDNVVYVIAKSGDDNANKITWLFVDTNNDLEKVQNPADAADETAVSTAADTTLKGAVTDGGKDGKTVANAWTTNATKGTTSTDAITVNLTDVTTKVSVQSAGETKVTGAKYENGKIVLTSTENQATGTVVLKITVTAGGHTADRYVSVTLN